jgi:hypothetical protein
MASVFVLAAVLIGFLLLLVMALVAEFAYDNAQEAEEEEQQGRNFGGWPRRTKEA